MVCVTLRPPRSGIIDIGETLFHCNLRRVNEVKEVMHAWNLYKLLMAILTGIEKGYPHLKDLVLLSINTTDSSHSILISSQRHVNWK